jgi:large-conductance mechanosensitive channel
MKDFVNFVREQGVVGMAVGLAIGLAATDTVARLVEGFINPIVSWLIGAFVNNPDALSELKWEIISGDNPLVIMWGDILAATISLVAVAFVIFFVVKKLKLDKLDKKKS